MITHWSPEPSNKDCLWNSTFRVVPDLVTVIRDTPLIGDLIGAGFTFFCALARDAVHRACIVQLSTDETVAPHKSHIPLNVRQSQQQRQPLSKQPSLKRASSLCQREHVTMNRQTSFNPRMSADCACWNRFLLTFDLFNKISETFSKRSECFSQLSHWYQLNHRYTSCLWIQYVCEIGFHSFKTNINIPNRSSWRELFSIYWIYLVFKK